MPVSVVVGGQFGSEGKGKVAHWLVSKRGARWSVRVGGPNSGHTVIDQYGQALVLRQLPTASVLPNVMCVLSAGCYVDPTILEREMRVTNLGAERLVIDPNAVVITEELLAQERMSGLAHEIGSTESGTGAAVLERVRRRGGVVLAKDFAPFRPFVRSTLATLRSALVRGDRVVIEGTQGYGLSLYHSSDYPYSTSRDTTAAGFLAEVGLSPFDVDEIVLVLRSFPIRVAGNSGPLPRETEWATLTRISGSDSPLIEYTSVTKRVRRVAAFDPVVVRAAIEANLPSVLVLNHVDYFDQHCATEGRLTKRGIEGVRRIEHMIGRPVDLVGISRESHLIDRCASGVSDTRRKG